MDMFCVQPTLAVLQDYRSGYARQNRYQLARQHDGERRAANTWARRKAVCGSAVLSVNSAKISAALNIESTGAFRQTEDICLPSGRVIPGYGTWNPGPSAIVAMAFSG